MPLAQGLRDPETEHEEGDEVEERGPQHRGLGRHHAGGDHGGDGVRRVVKTVQEVEDQGHQNDEPDEGKGDFHALWLESSGLGAGEAQAFFSTTLPIAWVYSLHASQALSRPSYTSFHFMISMGLPPVLKSSPITAV